MNILKINNNKFEFNFETEKLQKTWDALTVSAKLFDYRMLSIMQGFYYNVSFAPNKEEKLQPTIHLLFALTNKEITIMTFFYNGEKHKIYIENEKNIDEIIHHLQQISISIS